MTGEGRRRNKTKQQLSTRRTKQKNKNKKEKKTKLFEESEGIARETVEKLFVLEMVLLAHVKEHS